MQVVQPPSYVWQPNTIVIARSTGNSEWIGLYGTIATTFVLKAMISLLQVLHMDYGRWIVIGVIPNSYNNVWLVTRRNLPPRHMIF